MILLQFGALFMFKVFLGLFAGLRFEFGRWSGGLVM